MQVHLTMQWDHTANGWFCWDFLQDQLKACMSSKVFYRLDISAPFPVFSSVLKTGQSQPLADEKFSCCTITMYFIPQWERIGANAECESTLLNHPLLLLPGGLNTVSEQKAPVVFLFVCFGCLFLVCLFVRPACRDWYRLKIIATGLSIPHLFWKAKVL